MTSLPLPPTFCPTHRPPSVPRSIQAAMYHPIPMSLIAPAHLLPMVERLKIITHIEKKAQWAEDRFIY